MNAEVTRLDERPTIDHADIRWRVSNTWQKGDTKMGMLVGYIDARTCMEALDLLDADWSAVHGDPIIVGNELIGVPCALTVNGVTRSDVGMPSSQEPIKGAYSDALKRAAVHFGIGRELYELPKIAVECEVGRDGKVKAPKATPIYRNGRWTIDRQYGWVKYDREPDDQPERSERAPVATGKARRDSSPAKTSAPVQRTPEENALLDELMAVPGMTIARASMLADEVGVEKGTHANASQLRAMLERATEQPSSAGAIADGGDRAAESRSSAAPTTPAEQDSSADPATATAASSPPGGAPSSAPSLDDILSVTGGELLPPKPGTPEYRALPNGTERANAKAYWDGQKAEPQQESLAEVMGAPTSD